jgi:hypothetical protein
MTAEKFKLQTNIPLECTFKYDKPKVWENQGEKGPYKTYSYAITVGKVEGYLGLYEHEAEKMKPFEPLSGKTLVLLKHEVGGNKKEFSVTSKANVSLQEGMKMATEFNGKVKHNPESMTGTMDELAHPAVEDEEQIHVVCSDEVIADRVEIAKKIIGLLGYKEVQDIPEGQSAIVNTLFMDIAKRI